MSVPLTINGVTFNYPQEFDTNWGPTLTNWSTAVTNALIPITGGTLTVPNNQAGVQWRNFSNTAYLPLTVNTSNQLTFNGTPIGATVSLTNNHIFVGNASNQPTDVAMSGDIGIVASGATTIQAGVITNSKVSSGAAIALTKLGSSSPYYWYTANSSGVLTPIAISPSLAVLSDSNGLPTTGLTTATEIGYVHGVTSAIQTQINNLGLTYLPLSGGTMSGSINMGSNIISSLTQGTSAGQAIAFPIGTAQISSGAVSQNVRDNNIASPDSAGTTIISDVITTVTNASVLILAQASLLCTRTSGLIQPSVSLVLTNGSGTTLAESYFSTGNGLTWTNGNSVTVSLNISYIDVPSAGTQTYTLSYHFVAGNVTVESYNFNILQLKV